MKKKVKQALTLLEVNIAIFITGILLSALWGMYHNWYKSYEKAQKMQTNIHRTLFIKHRLEQVFSLVARTGKSHFMFSPSEEGEKSLCISYEGPVDPDPFFNKTLRSLLYKDELNRFCLATWASEEASRVEVLLDKVSLLEFFFFDTQTASWQTSWKEDLDHLPLWVKVHIKRDKEDEIFIFRSEHLAEPILYLEAFEGGGAT